MKSKQLPKIIAIVGPTASGKSDLGISLALKFNGEIISADSRQVYRGMDIGTGKVSKKEQRLVPHHLIDIVAPKTDFSAANFKSRAERTIADIFRRGKTPIIVGGTGFYIDTLVYNLNLPEVPPNKKLRAKLEKQTTEELFIILQKKDPERAKNIDKYNKRRLIRALEIVEATDGIVPKLKKENRYNVLWLGISPKSLEKRIKMRLNKRLKQGMIKEVKDLLRSGVSERRLYDFGLEYRWVGEYLAGKINYVEMKDSLYKAIVKYSKRQMTWFKRNKEIRWIKGREEATRLVRYFLEPVRL